MLTETWRRLVDVVMQGERIEAPFGTRREATAYRARFNRARQKVVEAEKGKVDAGQSLAEDLEMVLVTLKQLEGEKEGRTAVVFEHRDAARDDEVLRGLVEEAEGRLRRKES